MDKKYDTRFALAFAKDIFGAKTESYVFERKENKGSTIHSQIYNELSESLLQLADIGINDSFFKNSGLFRFLWKKGEEQFVKSGEFPPPEYFSLDKEKCFFDEKSGRFRVFMTKQKPGTSKIEIGEWGYLGVLLEVGDDAFKGPLKIAWALEGDKECAKPKPEPKEENKETEN